MRPKYGMKRRKSLLLQYEKRSFVPLIFPQYREECYETLVFDNSRTNLRVRSKSKSELDTDLTRLFIYYLFILHCYCIY